ncbi:MAG: cupredoxin domain-containing protein [Chloroflexi bacterium]|nr:cupredoxin domain-containing protein [Chloroflexota bacterium]
MRKGTFFAGALLLSFSLALAACGGSEPAPTATATKAPPTATNTPRPPAPTPTTPPATTGDNVIKVSATENPYTWVPNKLDLKVGQEYTVEIAAPKEFHTFTINDLGVNIIVNPGQAMTQKFTPTKAGTFKLSCLPHESLGMVGEVVVS